MNIDRSREILYDYARGRLSEQDRLMIEEQLSSSDQLRSEFENIKAYYAAIQEMEPVPVPEGFLEKVHQRIDSRGQRSLLNRLLYPLHLKLPIEFAGVAATVLLVIFVFFPQFDKRKFTEYEPVPSEQVQQVSPSLRDEAIEKPVAAITETKKSDNKQLHPEKKSSAQKVERSLGVAVQQPKSSVPEPVKGFSTANAGVNEVDQVPPAPASIQPPMTSAPEAELASAPPVQQTIAGNNEVNKSEYASAIAPAPQEDKPQISYSKGEEPSSESRRSSVSFEKKRMKFRSEKAGKSDEKEMAPSMDMELSPVSKDIPELLAKYGMKLVVKESTEYTTTCRASGTSKAVQQFLREIKNLPDVTLLKTIPENFSTRLDSVIVEFSVKVK
jgi:hypothetical protein